MKRLLFCIAMLVAMTSQVFAQIKDVSSMTQDDIMELTYDELLEMPFEDVMKLADKLGVSTDELFAMIMNKSVSSASKAVESNFVSPLSTTVITQAEMRTYGITTIEEAFRLIPGMIVTEKTNGNYDIQMRGLNNIPDNNTLLYTENANTLVMVDGRQIRNSVLGALTFEMLPISIEDVERIEVVRGASGALYGSNAVSGVINIITEKPDKQSKMVSGAVQAGNNNTIVGDIALRKSLANNKISAGLTFNIQQRGRNTDKLYVMPSTVHYMANDKWADQTVKNQIYGTPENGYMQFNNDEKIYYGEDLKALTDGGWYSASEIQNVRQLVKTQIPLRGFFNNDSVKIASASPTDAVYRIYNATEPETPIADMFHDTDVSRKNIGVNGYINFTPNADVNISLSGGYGESRAMTTAVRDAIFSMNERNAKTSYANLNAQIYGLQINFGYEGGPQDYAYGVPGYKIKHNMMNGGIEYTLKLGDLSVKPAFDFQWAKYTDYLPVFNDSTHTSNDYSWHYEDADAPADSYTRLYGFLNGSATLYAVAPSLRLDYKFGGLRLIGAIRADKTNTPDMWYPSWQLAANYEINSRNFVRFVYGRANRGASLINTDINLQRLCTNMEPQRFVYMGNKDAKLVKIDNFEVGYRWKPTDNILVDTEVFYSKSTDYGALMSSETKLAASVDQIKGTLGGLLPQAMGTAAGIRAGMTAGGAPEPAIQAAIAEAVGGMCRGVGAGLDLETRSFIQYSNLPYKVNQYGLSLNVDWIISPKLIAKVNANIQQTKINDYYPYSLGDQIGAQLGKANTASNISLVQRNMVYDIVSTVMQYGGNTMPEIQAFVGRAMQEANVEEYAEQIGWSTMNPDQQNNLLAQLYEAGVKGEAFEGNASPLSSYYSLKYNVVLSDNDLCFGNTSAVPYTLSNGRKHKATPTIYGMAGLIYKPIDKVNVSMFANYIGSRTSETQYGTLKLDDRFTLNAKVGYAPIKNLEIFVNGHNLLNSKAQEFIYSDEIGGLYTAGLKFEF
ncbi:MAG: TonB-dependent receptor [Salinivirgaceae bacterium]|nr:TonB-dependent receptor [Salinivirgaceae bacterium]